MSLNEKEFDYETKENEELGEYDEEIPEAEANLFSSETVQEIIEAKKNKPSQFQSYWENDEDDIDPWTKKEIKEDPGKQLLTHAENGDLDLIKELINSRPEALEIETLLRYKDSDGYTGLHRAAYSNQLSIVKYLISFQDRADMPELNQLAAKTDMGWTPLHSSVYWNCYKIVEYLLKYANADVNCKSNSGQTPLHLAAQQSENRESLILLLTHDSICFSARNDQGESALQIALRSSKYHDLFEICEDNLNFI